jgi:hypothetical protein
MTSHINGEQQEREYLCTGDLIPQGTWDRISPDGRTCHLSNSKQIANRLSDMHRLKYVTYGPSICSIYTIRAFSWDLPSTSNSSTHDQVPPCNSHIALQPSEISIPAVLPTTLVPRALSHICRAKKRLGNLVQGKPSRSDEEITTTSSPFPFTSISGTIDTPSQSTRTTSIDTAKSRGHSSEFPTNLEQDKPTLREDPVSLEEKVTHED